MSGLLEKTLQNFTHTRLDRPPRLLPKFPHLIGGDSNLWVKFLQQYPSFFDAVSYDVRVGEGMILEGDWSPEIADMATTLSQRRVDIIAEKDNKIWIVEIKVDPSVSLIGQLDAYLILFLNELETPVFTQLCTIVNRVNPDLITVLNHKDIRYFVV